MIVDYPMYGSHPHVCLLNGSQMQFIKIWRTHTYSYGINKVEKKSEACNYYLYKPCFEFEQYIDDLPLCYRIAFTKFRTANHKLPVEKGRYTNMLREQRTCNLCDSDHVGDEYHFLLECPALVNLRNKFIPKFFRTNPNFYKYSQLLSIKSGKLLLNLCKFIKEGLTFFKWSCLRSE